MTMKTYKQRMAMRHPTDQTWEAIGRDIVRKGFVVATASTTEEALLMAAAPDLFRTILTMITGNTSKSVYEPAMYKAVGGISEAIKLASGEYEADDES